MHWIEFVKHYMMYHPTVKWGEAMKRCKEPWARYKKQRKRKPRTRGKPYIPGPPEDIRVKAAKISKQKRKQIKDECGMYDIRPLTPTKYTTPKQDRKKQKKKKKVS